MNKTNSENISLPTTSTWIDITLNLHNNMVSWPGDPPTLINQVTELERGDSYTISQITLSSHAGTHIDAPAHFIKGNLGVDKMPLNIACGKARIIEILNEEVINIDELTRHKIKSGERILFKTRNSTLWKTDNFTEEFVYLSNEASRYLVERGISLIGTDYLSIERYKQKGTDVHKILLGAGIWIIEGLDLSNVLPGNYELICLPLKILNGDGAPARVIIKPLKKKPVEA